MSKLLCAVALLAFTAIAEARIITNEHPSFTLVVPDSLETIATQGDMIAAFATSDPALGIPDAAVNLANSWNDRPGTARSFQELDFRYFGGPRSATTVEAV